MAQSCDSAPCPFEKNVDKLQRLCFNLEMNKSITTKKVQQQVNQKQGNLGNLGKLINQLVILFRFCFF